jgi:hypothetical protein
MATSALDDTPSLPTRTDWTDTPSNRTFRRCTECEERTLHQSQVILIPSSHRFTCLPQIWGAHTTATNRHPRTPTRSALVTWPIPIQWRQPAGGKEVRAGVLLQWRSHAKPETTCQVFQAREHLCVPGSIARANEDASVPQTHWAPRRRPCARHARRTCSASDVWGRAHRGPEEPWLGIGGA